MRSWLRSGAAIAVGAVGASVGASAPHAAQTTTSPDYTTSTACAECHPSEAQAWRGSHHDLAMQVASPATVLADFGDTTFEYFGTTSTFSRKGDRYFVRTDGPDGELADFEIKYTFGVTPLQQYLIEFPDGRLQALGIAWDTRPAEAGGQRWFHIYPDEPVKAGDGLHWTDPNQNWNHMCAECHSTNLRKRYRADVDRFDTTWIEIDVACEACHGPGADHVAWARAGGGTAETGDKDEKESGKKGGDPALAVRFAPRASAQWVTTSKGALPHRVPPRAEHREIETCARCHARRSPIHEDYRFGQPFLDQHRLATLDEALYYPDGQIQDEVYVYGSFLQSRMYEAGVTCSDCHDPHSARLRADGNLLCAQCHDPGQYDQVEHHHHPTGSAGAQCVECHMPSTTYMVVDPRRDHSLRVPRPDLSDALATPNPCTGCHTTMTNRWASRKIQDWRGSAPPPEPHWGEALHAGRSGDADAGAKLAQLISSSRNPAIARASAVSLFPRYADRDGLAVVAAALRDPEPLVRAAALGALEGTEPELRLRLVVPLLGDPIRTVRFEAARVSADLPREQLAEADRQRLDSVLLEYRAAQRMDADRPDAQMRLAILELQQGKPDAAKSALERAIALDPSFIPAYVNLADFHRAVGDDAAGERVLRDALARAPQHPDVHHALGLALVRQGRLEAAIPELQRAAELRPEMPRYAFIWAVALHESGDLAGAKRVLGEAAARHPGDPQIRGFLQQLQARQP